ncbi:MAG: hypothetical protein RLZZ385_2005 [Pseudomonadota bacterium]
MDVRTILIVMILMSVASAIAVGYSRGLSNAMGERNWALSLLLDALAIILVGTQGSWPPLLSVVIANAVATGGFALKYVSVAQCFRRRPDMMVAAAPVVAVLVIFPFFLSNMPMRILIVSAAVLVHVIAMLRILMQPLPEGWLSAQRLLVATGFGFVVFTLVRCAYALTGLDGANVITTEGNVYALTALGFMMAMVLATFGILSLYNERLTVDIQRLATIDPLTNIYNRRAFINAAEKELARGDRSGRYPCLLMLDIDHFKRVNDTCGHAAGDQVLIAMTTALQEALREQDILARFGGEEFAILLPETERDGAIILAERLRAAVAALITRVGQKTLRITVSVGIAVAVEGDTLDDLVGRADQAMYAAKEAGRNCVKIEPRSGQSTARSSS